jgi:hypothetical protein
VPATLPADGAERAFAPSRRAMEMASAIPRALNEPVGLRASSLAHTSGAAARSAREPFDVRLYFFATFITVLAPLLVQ